MKQLNIPNRLSLLRLCLVPVFMALMGIPELLPGQTGMEILFSALAAFVFILCAVTDMIDGKIARKYIMITDFGKFIDPVADKFMVIGAMMMLVFCDRYAAIRPVLFWGVVIVVFRELAVTAVRLVALSAGGQVIAANMLGKIKTVTQIVCVCAAIIEPLLCKIPLVDKYLSFWGRYLPITYTSIAVMTIFTLWSGINYIVCAWKYINPNK